MTGSWYEATRKSKSLAIVGLCPHPTPSCRVLGSNDGWGRGRGCRGVGAMGKGKHEASHESSPEEPAGLLVCQMYHIGVAWRSEVDKIARRV